MFDVGNDPALAAPKNQNPRSEPVSQSDNHNDNRCERCQKLHRFVGMECPTCIYLGKTFGRGTLFFQHRDIAYECDTDCHVFDETTLGILETLTPWKPAPPTNQESAKQADQPIGDS